MRTEKRITLPATAGRDAGKTFVIREMAARVGHRWATRAVFGLLNAGATIPDNLLNAGWAAIAAMGLEALGKLPVAVAEPLLDELFSCVTIQPGTDTEITRALIESDIDEVMTLFLLQKEVLALHVNFSKAASLSTSE